LNASTPQALCKSLLLENRKYFSAIHDQKVLSTDDPTYPRFVLVIIQYISSLNTCKLTTAIRSLQSNILHRIDSNYFDWRVAESIDNDRITGYAHNSVTPFGMLIDDQWHHQSNNNCRSINDNTNMDNVRVILSLAAASDSRLLWMGGGHVHLKLGVATSEFMSTKFCNNHTVLVADITTSQ
jgi:hypothetical protein